MYACKHVCMYVCKHVCMYVCMYVCKHVCMHVCMHACMYACMYACTSACMSVSVYVCQHVCMYVCMYVCKHVCIYIYIYMFVAVWSAPLFSVPGNGRRLWRAICRHCKIGKWVLKQLKTSQVRCNHLPPSCSAHHSGGMWAGAQTLTPSEKHPRHVCRSVVCSPFLCPRQR